VVIPGDNRKSVTRPWLSYPILIGNMGARVEAEKKLSLHPDPSRRPAKIESVWSTVTDASGGHKPGWQNYFSARGCI
jgi:hypothetical protein